MVDIMLFSSALTFFEFGSQALVVTAVPSTVVRGGPRSSSPNFHTKMAYRLPLHRRVCSLVGIHVNPKICTSLKTSRVLNDHNGISGHFQKKLPHHYLVLHAEFEKESRNVQQVEKISPGGGNSNNKNNNNDNDDDDGNKDLKNSEKIDSDRSKQDLSGSLNNKKRPKVSTNKESYDDADDFNAMLEIFSSDDLKATEQLIKRVQYDIDHRVGTNINRWIDLERKLFRLKQIVEEGKKNEEDLEAARGHVSSFFGLEEVPAEIEFIVVLTTLVVTIGLFIALFYLNEFSKNFWQPFLPF